MNRVLIIIILFSFCCHAQTDEKQAINDLLDQWHRAAAEADYDTYFSSIEDEGIFIGTDASENWSKKAFAEFSKPYFDRGKAWSFAAIERNVYIAPEGNYAWFDELLNTWMDLCRGSGVLKKVNGQWKIAHYVLSMTIPNDEVNKVIPLKKEADSIYKAGIRN